MDFTHVFFQLGEIPRLGSCAGLRIILGYLNCNVEILVRSWFVQSTPQVLILVLSQLWKVEMSNGVQVQLRDNERIKVVFLGLVQV